MPNLVSTNRAGNPDMLTLDEPSPAGAFAYNTILCDIKKTDLELVNMTPNPRYYALNDAMNRLRGGAYEFYLQGLDELQLQRPGQTGRGSRRR